MFNTNQQKVIDYANLVLKNLPLHCHSLIPNFKVKDALEEIELWETFEIVNPEQVLNDLLFVGALRNHYMRCHQNNKTSQHYNAAIPPDFHNFLLHPESMQKWLKKVSIQLFPWSKVLSENNCFSSLYHAEYERISKDLGIIVLNQWKEYFRTIDFVLDYHSKKIINQSEFYYFREKPEMVLILKSFVFE